MAKNMFGRVVRSATSLGAQYNTGTGSFNIYVFEYVATEIKYGTERFYVATVRAHSLTEAKHELHKALRAKKFELTEVVRTFDKGADRSWLQGNRNSWVKGTSTFAAGIVEVKMFDRELYEQINYA